MPEFKVKTADGQEGTFDPIQNLIANSPDMANARITSYDAKTKTVKATLDKEFGEAAPGDYEFNLDDFAKHNGLSLGDMQGDFNSPESAADSSPVNPWTRFRLGLANSEAGDAKRLADITSKMAGMTGFTDQQIDARSEKNQARALGMLKKEFQDAKIVNGEYVVKQDNVWHKVNSPGNDAGDWAEFAAGNGLNVLFGVVGGFVGSAVPVAGTAAGAGTGQVLAEGAEELLRYAIERDSIDVATVSQDMLVEGLFGATGEAIVKAAAPLVKAGASKLGTVAKSATKQLANVFDARGADALSEAANMSKKAVSNTITGMRNFADKAAEGTKDMVAELFGSGYGAKMSVPTTRAMLESPETVQQSAATAARYSSGIAGKVAVEDEMIITMKNAQKAVEKASSKAFGETINRMKKASTKPENIDKVDLNLTDMHKNLKTLLDNAPEADQKFLSRSLKEVDALLAGNKKAAVPTPKSTAIDWTGAAARETAEVPGDVILKGPKALEALRSIKAEHGHVMRTAGSYNPNGQVSVSPGTNDAMISINKLLTSKMDEAASNLNMTAEFKAANTKYFETENALDVVRSKINSSKTALTNVAGMAKGTLGADEKTGLNNVQGAINKIIGLHPNAGFDKALNKVRVMQSGIDSIDWLSIPRGTLKQTAIGSGAVATTAGGVLTGAVAPVVGLGLVAPVFSPRIANWSARKLASGGVKAANSLKGEGAELAAKQLVRMATSLGSMRAAGQTGFNTLIANPDAFKEHVQKSKAFIDDAQNATQAKVTDAAVEKVNSDGK